MMREVDSPPAHHAVDCPVGPGFPRSRQVPPAAPPIAGRTPRVEAMHPVPDVWRSIPPILAASARLILSSTVQAAFVQRACRNGQRLTLRLIPGRLCEVLQCRLPDPPDGRAGGASQPNRQRARAGGATLSAITVEQPFVKAEIPTKPNGAYLARKSSAPPSRATWLTTLPSKGLASQWWAAVIIPGRLFGFILAPFLEGLRWRHSKES